MNTKAKLLAATSVALILGGCGTTNVLQEPGDSVFGEANRQTMMAQVINPEPVYDEPMTTSGEHAANAVERYRNDQVPDPSSQSTTRGVTGGSGGGGGGG